LPIVVKADVQGTLEALLSSLSDDVFLIASGVGTVTDNDVFLAASSKAQIFAYNVSVPRFIRNLADNQKVPLFESKIIYEIIDDIQAQVLRLLDPTIEETTLGEAKIIAEFKIEKVRIAGIEVVQGEISPGDSIHLRRDDAIIKDTKVEGIRQAKTVVDQAKSGSQYGVTFKPYIDFKIGDVIIAYKS
jgi:translation initiation factor IF-2